MKFSLKNKDEYIKIIKYAIVGVANTLMDWVVYFVLTKFIYVEPWIANVVGYVVGMLSSFVGNKFFTFKAKNTKTGIELVKFVIINMISLGVSTGVIALTTSVWSWNKYIAKILSTGTSMTINYIGSRFFVFENKQ